MPKALHTHGNTPHGGADFYPLLPEVGQERFKGGTGLGVVGSLAVSIDACAPVAVALSPTLATPCMLRGANVDLNNTPPARALRETSAGSPERRDHSRASPGCCML